MFHHRESAMHGKIRSFYPAMYLMIMLCVFLTISAGSAQEIQKVTTQDGDAADFVGTSVAIDGNLAISGAPGEDENGAGAGAVYVFEQSGGEWSEIAKIIADDGELADRFGDVVDLSNQTILVGAPYDDAEALNDGSAYIFTRLGDSWVQHEKLTPHDPLESSFFGASVAIRGNRAIVGAIRGASGGIRCGAAYVFIRVGRNWEEMGKLVPHDGAEDDLFGSSVAIDGNFAVIGAKGDDDRGLSSGSVYFFHWNGTEWEEMQKISIPEGRAEDSFGIAADLEGTRACIGMRGTFLEESPGYAYLYEIDGPSWNLTNTFSAEDGEDQDHFGQSLSIWGDYALIGARNDQDNGVESGSVYAYAKRGDVWMMHAKVLAPDGEEGDFFGYDVDLSGDFAIVGARGDDDAGENAGAVYLIDLQIPEASLQGRVTDAVTGFPLPQVSIELQDPETGMPEGGATQTDEQGEYFLQYVHGGMYHFHAEIEGYFPVDIEEYTVTSDSQQILGFHMDEVETRLSGLVYDSDTGGAVHRAEVVLWDQDENVELLTETTNDTGYFRFSQIPEGTYRLELSATGYFPSSRNNLFVATDTDRQEFFGLTPRRNSISGWVTHAVNGNPVIGATVRLLNAFGGEELSTTETSWGGAFYFAELEPGYYTLEVTAENYQNVLLENIQLNLFQEIQIPIEIYPLETGVYGVVTEMGNGNPVQGVQVSLLDGIERTLVDEIYTDINGNYHFSYITDGIYDLRFLAIGYIPGELEDVPVDLYQVLQNDFELQAVPTVDLEAAQTHTAEGDWITTIGVVTIPDSILTLDRFEAYIQDQSGYGIRLYREDFADAGRDVSRGYRIRLTGKYTESGFYGISRLIDFEYEILAENQPLPDPMVLASGELAANRSYEGSWAEVSGRFLTTPSQQGSFVFSLNDGSGNALIKINEEAGLDLSSYHAGDWVTIHGVIELNQGFVQLVPAFQEDFLEYNAIKEESTLTPLDFRIASVYPNPFNSTAVVNIQVPQDGKLNLSLYDILGREMMGDVSLSVSSGMNRYVIQQADMAAGIYFLQAELNTGETSLAKLLYVR